jgi:hypothetical protein
VPPQLPGYPEGAGSNPPHGPVGDTQPPRGPDFR